MASAWVERRATSRGVSYRVKYRLGGRESRSRYAGAFHTKREARTRCDWVRGELAARRVPDLAALVAPAAAPLLREKAKEWQASRVDVRESTTVQHRTALARVLPVLGDLPVDSITSSDVARLVAKLVADGKARESIRKSVTALAMVLDFAEIAPNPARNKVLVKLPREEAVEPEPPSADHIEDVAWLLKPDYLFALLVLDATGVRVGELEAARVGDLDKQRKGWLVRSAVAKTRRARWVALPDDLFDALLLRIPAREDRDPAAPLFAGATADRLRTAIGRACRDSGVVRFSPHALRHRRISLLHHQGLSWAEVGAMVGQRSKLVTADRYTHVLIDYREVDREKLLARAVPSCVPSSVAETAALAGMS